MEKWLFPRELSTTVKALREIHTWLHENQVKAYLCGGAIRDVVLRGQNVEIKDLDVMFHSDSEEILQMCQDLGYGILRGTILGGLKVSTPSGVIIDLWQLKESYGITEPTLKAYLESVPTNIESVVMSLTTGNILEEGFIEAINDKSIEPMFNEIPRESRWLRHRIEYLQRKAGFTS